jgi:NADH:ubiquinone oxidoreductase subunit C
MNPQVFIDIAPAQMRARVESYHQRAWRFVQICGSTVPEGVELLYSFSDGEPLENLRMVVSNGTELPSITDLYFNAFFFENETHDLFGVKFKGIAIDFGGAFYPASVPAPMNPAAASLNEGGEA